MQPQKGNFGEEDPNQAKEGDLLTQRQIGKKIRGDQSPTLKKNKIERLLKLKSTVMQKREERELEAVKLEEEKTKLEILLNAKQSKNQAGFILPDNGKSSQSVKHEEEINLLLTQIAQEKQRANKESEAEASEIIRLEEQLRKIQAGSTFAEMEKDLDKEKQLQVELAKKTEKEKADGLRLEQEITQLSKQKQANEGKVKQREAKLAEEKQKREDLAVAIKKCQVQLASKQSSLQSLKEQAKPKVDVTSLNENITVLLDTSTTLKNTKKHLEEQIAKRKSESEKVKEAEKNKNAKINEARAKNEASKRKLKALQEEIQRIQEGEKNERKPKYEQKKGKNDEIQKEQKNPEELIALQGKNSQLKAELNKVKEAIDQERKEMEKLVPPHLIEKTKDSIAKIISENAIAEQLLKENQHLYAENKQLDARQEELEWEVNPTVTEAETQINRLIQKTMILQGEISATKKKEMQLKAKVQEYTLEYPDYKPKPIPKVEMPAEKKKTSGKEQPKVEKKEEQPKLQHKVQEPPRIETKEQAPKKEENKEKAKKKNKKAQIEVMSAEKPPNIELLVPKVKIEEAPKEIPKAEPKAQPNIVIATKPEVKMEAKQAIKAEKAVQLKPSQTIDNAAEVKSSARNGNKYVLKSELKQEEVKTAAKPILQQQEAKKVEPPPEAKIEMIAKEEPPAATKSKKKKGK